MTLDKWRMTRDLIVYAIVSGVMWAATILLVYAVILLVITLI